MIVDVKVRTREEDGQMYCLIDEFDHRYRDELWEFAFHRGETFFVNEERAVSFDALVAYGNLTGPAPKYTA